MKAVSTFSTSNKQYQAPPSRMEAIASGVQVRLEERTGYSKLLIDETINIARVLGVSNTEIEKWASARLERLARDMERSREIKSLLKNT